MSGADLAGLRPLERRRLERFAAGFELVDASAYATLAEARPDEAVRRAEREALAFLGNGPRKQAVRAAVEAFTEAATRAYARRTSLPDTIMLFQSLPDRAEDRVRVLASIERAVVAVILWDELPEAERDALLGPWARVAEQALAAGADG